MSKQIHIYDYLKLDKPSTEALRWKFVSRIMRPSRKEINVCIVVIMCHNDVQLLEEINHIHKNLNIFYSLYMSETYKNYDNPDFTITDGMAVAYERYRKKIRFQFSEGDPRHYGRQL